MMKDIDREIIDEGLADLFECAATDRFGVDEFKRRVWALFSGAQPCAHRLVDARNGVVESGYMCVDCGAVFAAADHGTNTYRQALDEIVKNDPFNQSSAGVIARAAIAKESGQ